MMLNEISKILEAELIGNVNDLNKEIKMVYGSDLMSDVLAFVESDSLLLTGSTNIQIVRTAEIADVTGICIVRGKKPQEETVKLADEKKIPLLVTKLSMYESCGRLYKEGLPGYDEFK